jgi:hypothetical protein
MKMKTVLLASSLFFLIGLKISNKVDLIKKTSSPTVVTNKLEYPEIKATNLHSKDEATSKTDLNAATDTSKTKTSVIRFR